VDECAPLVVGQGSGGDYKSEWTGLIASDFVAAVFVDSWGSGGAVQLHPRFTQG